MMLSYPRAYHDPDPRRARGFHREAKTRTAREELTVSDFALRGLRGAVARPTFAEISARIRLLEPVEDAPPAAELVRAERDER